jgi:hypothetical protein
MRRVGLVVLVVVVLGMVVIVLRGRCDEGEDVVEFPYTVEIAPGNYLFVDGHEFHGEVVCTWEPGDSVRIEGIPVLPSRPVPRRERSEAELMEKYGDDAFMLECIGRGMTWKEALREKELRRRHSGVPFVEKEVDKGATWHEAVNAYNREVDKVIDGVDMAYWEALVAGGSKTEAMQAALDSLDRSLLDPAAEVKASESGMSIQFEGRPGRISFFFPDKPPWEMPTLEELQRVTPKKAQGLARSLARTMKGYTGTWMVVISSQVGEMTFAGRAVSKALKQIEEGEKGRLTTGPLPERELKLILSVREVKIDESDE